MLRTNQPIMIDFAGPPPPARPRRRRGRVGPILAVAFLLLILWLTATAPVSRTLEPVVPGITLLAADGSPIARRGAIVADPVDVDNLPPHVAGAFVAIEDRRFHDHHGISLQSMARAAWNNLRAGGVREGGSTITQQLAKLAFLSSDRTAARKLREIVIALWLEAWLSKEEILSRYLSMVYFGDNVYGLRAAAKHYFRKSPEALTASESAMLAGLVKAPSRLAPTSNPKGARERSKLVIEAMVRNGSLSRARADALPPARIRRRRAEAVPSGSYFADWLLAELDREEESVGAEREIRTTLDPRLQRLAERAVERADLDGAQAALVAMRPDGRVVAMVGGRDYGKSPFNRVTRARRQPGSTFKLFVYLAALEDGLKPDSIVLDAPVTVDGWSPENSDGRYRGPIPLREAFAISSNVAAVRLAERVGRGDVIGMARRLGIESPLEAHPSLPLGTSTLTLLELTSAYAGVASNRFPVRARGLREERGEEGGEEPFDEDATLPMILDLLWQSANAGTGKAAALPVPTFGKTGTTQDYRDALFVGFVRNLVVGVWVGRDDGAPLAGVTGGGLPAEIWRDFVGATLEKPAVDRKRERRPQRTVQRRFRDDEPRWGERGKGKGKGKGKRKRDR